MKKNKKIRLPDGRYCCAQTLKYHQDVMVITYTKICFNPLKYC